MQTVSSSEAGSAATLDRSKILVVNDSPDFLTFMRELLTLEGGYEVATLDQSEGVVEQVTSTPPDMIILDLVFRGGLSGYDIADRLASAAATAGIPILFCTALSVRDIPEQARALLDERKHRVLFKPFDIDELLTHVEEMLLQLHRS
ncbi:MAG: response regulator [Chloroflexota bacterium]|nr:response regulator [Chloroflexota bacterium]